MLRCRSNNLVILLIVIKSFIFLLIKESREPRILGIIPFLRTMTLRRLFCRSGLPQNAVNVRQNKFSLLNQRMNNSRIGTLLPLIYCLLLCQQNFLKVLHGGFGATNRRCRGTIRLARVSLTFLLHYAHYLLYVFLLIHSLCIVNTCSYSGCTGDYGCLLLSCMRDGSPRKILLFMRWQDVRVSWMLGRSIYPCS